MDSRSAFAGRDRASAAGLILEPVHFQKFGERNIHCLEDALRPLVELLAPAFFVQMGSNSRVRK